MTLTTACVSCQSRRRFLKASSQDRWASSPRTRGLDFPLLVPAGELWERLVWSSQILRRDTGTTRRRAGKDPSRLLLWQSRRDADGRPAAITHQPRSRSGGGVPDSLPLSRPLIQDCGAIGYLRVGRAVGRVAGYFIFPLF